MIGARSGQATLSRCTCGSAAATARSYAPLATVAGVASRPEAPGVAAGHRELGRRRDHADHVDVAPRVPEVFLERPERRRAGRVARDHEQLRALLEQLVGDLDRERAQLLGCAPAVGKPRRVAEVEVVLGRQRHEQLVQHGQSADAGIEHGDGVLGARDHRVDGARRAGGGELCF